MTESPELAALLDKMQPETYAYRYPDGVRYGTLGRSINGHTPTADEVFPLYSRAQVGEVMQRVMAEKKAAKNAGALDVLYQIRSFRKSHPMEDGITATLEFIGNLYHQYEKADQASRQPEVKK